MLEEQTHLENSEPNAGLVTACEVNPQCPDGMFLVGYTRGDCQPSMKRAVCSERASALAERSILGRRQYGR